MRPRRPALPSPAEVFPRRPSGCCRSGLCVPAAAVAIALLAAGCGDGSTGPPAPGAPAVTVSPQAATVIVRGTLQLAARVENLPGEEVVWSLARQYPTPDSADVGTLVATGPTTAVYTAPERVRSLQDYRLAITATSAVADTVSGTAEITVPRIMVAVTPGSVASVPPGTLVPFLVTVRNTTVPGYRLYVQGTEGGDPSFGTWTQTGDETTVFEAPASFPWTTTLDLLVTSADDSTRFSTSIVTVRRGYPLPVTRPEFGQYAPAWSPTEHALAYVQGGPPWEVAVYDFAADRELTLATFTWPGAPYMGKLSWSSDGSKLAFSEMQSGARAIGVVTRHGERLPGLAGGGHLMEASFVPRIDPVAPESLVVARIEGSFFRDLGVWPLGVPDAEGRRLYSADAGAEVRWPDAGRPGLAAGDSALYVAAVYGTGESGTLFWFVDDGSPFSPSWPAGGSGQLTHVRWAQAASGPAWLTYIWSGTRTAYRVHPRGAPGPMRLYSEFFPELGADLSTVPGFDAHAVSRLMPSGQARIWVVEFPPPTFDGVPAAEDRELAAMGIRGALAPSAWGRWLGAFQPRTR